MRNRTLVYVAAIVTLGVLSFKLVPWFTTPRTQTVATPSLAGRLGPAFTDLAPGSRACVSPVPLTPAARRAQFLLFADSPQPLTVTATAPGFAAKGRIPADYPVKLASGISAALDRAPDRTLKATVCVRNDGTHTIGLGGSGDDTPALSTIGGKPVDSTDFALTIFGEDRSIAAQASTMVDRAAALSALPPLVVWLIVLLAFVAAPVVSVVAVARTFDD